MNSYNQKIVYPDHCLPPINIQRKINDFKIELKKSSEIYEKSNQSKKDFEILCDNLREAIEEYILPSSIKITGVLDKGGISKMLQKLDKLLDDQEFMYYYHLLMQAGFLLSSIIPVSFQPEALVLPDEFREAKMKIVQKYNDSKKDTEDAIKFQKDITKLAEKVKKYFEDNNIDVVDMMNSKAKGNVDHIRALLLSVGLSIDSFGKINDVIDNSHTEAMTQTQFFHNSSQAVQALYFKSSETAKPGYLSRVLSTIGANIKLSHDKDCRTQRYLKLKITSKEVLESLIGRKYKKLGTLFTISESSDLVGKTIELRSPLYCQSKDGICNTCYNQDYIDKMQLKPGDNIGLLASTGLTEVLVSLTLKKSHVGVSLDQEEIDLEQELKDML